MGSFLQHYWRDFLEVVLMGSALLYAWLFLRRSDGARLLPAVLLMVLALVLVAHALKMELVRTFAFFVGVTLVIIFQPEMRRSFVSLGSHRLFSSARENMELLEALEDAVRDLSAKRFGALFAFERGMELESYLETGVEIDSSFSPELVLTIFHPKTALHDGGMILRSGRIVGAGCVFPISQREIQDRSIGLRHRAAMGITEQTDAIAVIVSEETGHISICTGGDIIQELTPERMTEKLVRLLKVKAEPGDKEKGKDTQVISDRTATKRLEA
jgi:diadenylate cyclase